MKGIRGAEPTKMLLLCLAVVSLPALARPSGDSVAVADSEKYEEGRPISVTGYVRDAACLFYNLKGGAPDSAVTRDCVDKCMRGGSPLIVYAPDGRIWFVISKAIPDTSELKRFLPYVGKRLAISGREFERAGAHAIVIDRFEVAEGKVSDR